MTEDRCPYCLSIMAVPPRPLTQVLSPSRYAVYKTVLDSGPSGATFNDLLAKISPGTKPATLRTCVHAINKVIYPMRLAGRGGRYFLERVEPD